MLPHGSSSAEWEELEIYNYQHVPYFNITYTELRPGESLDAPRAIHNRYNFSMENVHLTLELYRYRTLRESLDPDSIRDPPVISDAGGQTFEIDLGDIDTGQRADFTHPVRTTKKTPQATYFIRVKLDFHVNGTDYTMKSRGHFTADEWAAATANRSVVKDVDGELISTGGIDLDMLGVDGIVPETSITVYKPFTKIPLVIMAGLTGFVGLCALVFYMQEEKNMFPRAEWAYQRVMGKWITTKTSLEQMLDKKDR